MPYKWCGFRLGHTRPVGGVGRSPLTGLRSAPEGCPLLGMRKGPVVKSQLGVLSLGFGLVFASAPQAWVHVAPTFWSGTVLAVLRFAREDRMFGWSNQRTRCLPASCSISGLG